MLGIEDYGGSDSEHSDTEAVAPKHRPTLEVKKSATAATKPIKRPAKKVAIGLPELPVGPFDDLEEERPAAKKPRLDSGAGRSSLLGMLPAPKQNPTLPPPTRVLGGGSGPGLVFNTSRPLQEAQTSWPDDPTEAGLSDLKPPPMPTTTMGPPPAMFRPTSVGGKRANISLEEGKTPAKKAVVSVTPAVDFFSLGSSSSSTSRPTIATATPSSLPALPSISSAPQIEEFVPPEPTQTDPYPGYYQLPSGTWAAYDTNYFQSFYKKWEREYNSHVRALEKGMAKGFEGVESEGTQEVDLAAEMEKAKNEIQSREEKKAVTKDAKKEGELAAPRMNIRAGNRVANTRHQLSSLLREAYENRDALEERIAEGRRNRKESGNKYGF